MESIEIVNKINNIASKIKSIHGVYYGDQLQTIATDIFQIIDKYDNNNLDKYNLLLEMIENIIKDDYKNNTIISLKKKVKELENIVREQQQTIKEQQKIINQQQEEIKQLKAESMVKDIKIAALENKVATLETNISVLMAKHYNFVIWQAYKNLEYFIIQKATGYDSNKMETLNTNLTLFMNADANKVYLEEINKLVEKFNINSYKQSLGRLERQRNNEAHPDPIEMDELATACTNMKNKYPSIDELYNHYQEVYDYLQNNY